MTFLEQIVDDLAKQNINWGETAIVTPNQRAGLFIKKSIMENAAILKPVWLPQFYSIQDFVGTVSNLDLLDNFSLIFKLYPIYKEVFNNPRDFDTYYQWGRVVLSDFNETDLYLVDRKMLFTHLRDLSQIDAEFGGSGPMMADFVRFSASLEELYFTLQHKLMANEQGYYGLALRRIVEDFNEHSFDRWENIVFAGFNALSKAEQVLLEKLKKSGHADIYWDIDQYILNDEKQEAGYFLRDNPLIRDRTSVKWITDDLETSEKKIEIIGAAGRVAQAKALGSMLDDRQHTWDQTAVVLGDESLLFPVLHALPEDLTHINVTMGYPLKNTPLYYLLNAVIKLQNTANDAGDTVFRFVHVQDILMHPYVLPMSEFPIRELVRNARTENKILIDSRELSQIDARLGNIFRRVSYVSDFIDYIQAIMRDLINNLRHQQHLSIEVEYIYQFYTRLQRLNDVIIEHDINISLITFWKLFKEIIDTASVPFLGEPLQGLQIMGLLETRTLDFKDLYILSVNEGTLPAGQSNNSFIPNDVRSKCGMITHEHQDAIYAFYFYRLLKRAERIHILYNTVNDAFGKGECSRFIEQLIHEYARHNKNVEITRKTVNLNSVFAHDKAICIPKSNEILSQLRIMPYSPTRLQTYVDCSLKFYFKYILNLSEQDEVREAADARIFGTVMHEVLHRLFEPLVGQILSERHLNDLKNRSMTTIEQIYLEKMGEVDVQNGRNYLYIRIIETLISNFLNSQPMGIKIIETEVKYATSISVKESTLYLKGAIDRIEQQGDNIDIIDFKTGAIKSLQFSFNEDRTREQLLQELRDKPQILQLLIYYILASSHINLEGSESFRLGIYSFKEQKDSGKARFLSEKRAAPWQLGKAQLNKHISHIVAEIFSDCIDADTPFSQVVDVSKCGYCPYTSICGR
ncbi:PD-(D/E)XK nuclease family protein [bacterium]|nr:PD-(D/E)XK nuclease family protein [bacterium]